jgi:hypothetical protein
MEKLRMRVYDGGPGWAGVTGDLRRLQGAQLHDWYSLPNIVRLKKSRI